MLPPSPPRSKAAALPAPRLVIPDLAGKAVLITGGSTGIGAAVARGFAGQGAKVAIGYHASEGPALALAKELEAEGGEVLTVKGDVASPAECERIVAETTARFGRLDGLINNAGLMLGRVPSTEASDEHAQAVPGGSAYWRYCWMRVVRRPGRPC